MAQPPAIVDVVRRLETSDGQPWPHYAPTASAPAPPLDEDVWVRFANTAQRVRLNHHDPAFSTYRAVLNHLGRNAWPAYVQLKELTDDLSEITGLGVSKIVRVRDMRQGLPSHDVAVLLQPSAAEHILRVTNPKFNDCYWDLFGAWRTNTYVVVSEWVDSSEILEVTGLHASLQPFAESCKIEPLPEVMKSAARIAADVTVLDEQEATKLCLAMHDLGCRTTVNDTCTPFIFPKDGCHARAHEMCEQLLKGHGVRAAKIWIYASGNALTKATLCPQTPNAPGCVVCWNYHVAPLVRVEIGNAEEWQVIDPALFNREDGPVTIGRWIDRHRDSGATFVITEAALFDRAGGDLIQHDHWDPEFCYAPRELSQYRAALTLQLSRRGPPPYC